VRRFNDHFIAVELFQSIFLFFDEFVTLLNLVDYFFGLLDKYCDYSVFDLFFAVE